MSIQTRKAREREELRQKILEAAEKLFVEEGFANVSMRKIAAIIEYSPTTIYRFFENKTELLSTITAKSYKDLSERFEKIKAEKIDNSLVTLKSFIKEYILYALEKPYNYELFVTLCKLEIKDGTMYETIGDKRYKIFHSWLSLIAQGIEQGKFKSSDPVSILLLIWNTAHGFIMHRIKHPTLPWKSDEEEIAMIMDMIFNGLEK